jgi:hypothetical protein
VLKPKLLFIERSGQSALRFDGEKGKNDTKRKRNKMGLCICMCMENWTNAGISGRRGNGRRGCADYVTVGISFWKLEGTCSVLIGELELKGKADRWADMQNQGKTMMMILWLYRLLIGLAGELHTN